MKIIQIIPEFGYGGAETVVEKLSIAENDLGHNVKVISLYHTLTDHINRMIDKGIEVVLLDKKKGFDVRLVFTLYRIFQQEKPDVVHSHLYALKYAAIAAYMAKVKCVVHTVHNIAIKEMGKPDRLFNVWLYHCMGVLPIALSEEVRLTIADTYKIDKNRIPVVFNGITLSQFTPKKDYSLHKVPRIIHVGRFMEQKNHVAIIDAIKILQDKGLNFVVWLVGDGCFMNKIKDYVNQQDVSEKVRFFGETESVPTLLHESDVFILPSLWEGMPMTIIEAMASSLPILVSDVGGIRDMLKNGESALFCQPIADSIAEKLCELLQHIEIRQKIGQGARKEVERFSDIKMAENYCSVYEEKLDAKKKTT